MTYTYSDHAASVLPELPEGMRWVVLVDRRQIAVLLLENDLPVASASETLDRDSELDYQYQPVEVVEQVCARLAAEASHQWGFLHSLKQRLGSSVDVRMKLVDWNR